MTISEALSKAQTITTLYSDTPSLDAQVLLSHILETPRTWVLAHPEGKLTPNQQNALSQKLSQIESGTPLPYVLGHWDFYGLEFTVSPAVLIPRPETELLIEEALQWLRAHPKHRTAADIGTGSGCIAITLAKQIPNLQVTATDVSPDALDIAHTNADKHSVAEQIRFVQTNLLNDERTTFNIICANLPYIPTAALHSLDVYGQEPTLALDGGPDGLNAIRDLLKHAPQYLALGGLILLEIDSSQGISALSLAQDNFPNASLRLLPDLAGHDRLIRIET
ncbi:MAG: peptide chain release factor N(5)-glutamine methyltransferase [Anaerolineales bacterium]|nr:peptide chain release factor N(5)-glutamine methyltransferase [Anaerolineales bacterium]